MTIENMEGAIAMLEAYLSGGDELGIVPEDDAAEALNFIRGAVEWMGDTNSSELATMTAERDALKAQLSEAWTLPTDNLPANEKKVLVALARLLPTGPRRYALAYYVHPRSQSGDYYDGDDAEIDEDDNSWTPAGWYAVSEDIDTDTRIVDDVLCWRPLPEWSTIPRR